MTKIITEDVEGFQSFLSEKLLKLSESALGFTMKREPGRTFANMIRKKLNFSALRRDVRSKEEPQAPPL